MRNNSLLLVHPNFNADASANCRLLLKITNDSFSYAVIDQLSGEIKVIFDRQACDNVALELKDAFETDGHLTRQYTQIKAAIYTSKFIFVPDEWFDPTNLSIYSQYLGSEKSLYSKHHPEFGFNTIFSFEKQIEKKIPAQAILYPQSSPLIALISHLSAEALLIDFTAGSFNVLLVKEQKVNFQNHYQAENVEEFNYFLLLIINQLDLDDRIPVYLQGIINEDDDLYNTLLKYFNNLYFFLPAGKQDSALLADMPKHYFSGLLALDLCE